MQTVSLFRHYGDGAAVHPAAVHDDLRVAVPHAHAHGRRPWEGEEDQGEPQDGRPQGLRLLVSIWAQILVRIRIRGSIPLTNGSLDPDPAIFVGLRDSVFWWAYGHKFWCGSGSADPYLWLMDAWIRILLFSSVTFKTSTKNYFFPYYFLKVQKYHFSKIRISA